ncbi:hypothetical protein [Embleya sp. NBC_00896]|nr:hypothetical protein OG928_32655 [Embleya sp. NBC_00896]
MSKSWWSCISLDGVVRDSQWTALSWTDAHAKYQLFQAARCRWGA